MSAAREAPVDLFIERFPKFDGWVKSSRALTPEFLPWP